MTGNVVPFNPLDKKNLATMVAEALLTSPVHPLGSVPDFKGAGIYVIYYTGTFREYSRYTDVNKDGYFFAPIYVGKAIPEGGRKGQKTGTLTNTLSKRLREHADSVRDATNLKIEDFHCRYLVLDDIWIPLGESLIISRFQPLWNLCLEGFGNHDPGAGRYGGKRPRWDEIHPGREWATRCKPRDESRDDIVNDVRDYMRKLDLDQIVPPTISAEVRSSPGPVVEADSEDDEGDEDGPPVKPRRRRRPAP